MAGQTICSSKLPSVTAEGRNLAGDDTVDYHPAVHCAVGWGMRGFFTSTARSVGLRPQWMPVVTAIFALLCMAAPGRAEIEVFDEPHVKEMRLDWCLYWAHECGAPAADAFCRMWGYENALRYAIDQNIGRRGVVTLVLGDGRLCGAPTCSGFRWVTCQRE